MPPAMRRSPWNGERFSATIEPAVWRAAVTSCPRPIAASRPFLSKRAAAHAFKHSRKILALGTVSLNSTMRGAQPRSTRHWKQLLLAERRCTKAISGRARIAAAVAAIRSEGTTAPVP